MICNLFPKNFHLPEYNYSQETKHFLETNNYQEGNNHFPQTDHFPGNDLVTECYNFTETLDSLFKETK